MFFGRQWRQNQDRERFPGRTTQKTRIRHQPSTVQQETVRHRPSSLPAVVRSGRRSQGAPVQRARLSLRRQEPLRQRRTQQDRRTAPD